MILIGRVRSGLGEAWFWVKKIEDIFKEKTDMVLFHGTLNIELNNKYSLKEYSIMLDKEEYGGTQDVLIKECIVKGEKSYILRPRKNEDGTGSHPPTIIEIVSNINFREKYNLKNGEEIIIEI